MFAKFFHELKSAGVPVSLREYLTLMEALDADEIVLNPHAEKSPDATDDYTFVLADVGHMAIEQLKRAAHELLAGTVSENAATAIADQLATGHWTHDYPIEAVEAREIGLNVTTKMPPEISELMALFPDRLSRSTTKYVEPSTGFFGRLFSRPQAPAPRPEMRGTPPPSERAPFTGYEPHAGARSFSYGPWNPKDLQGQLPPGPAADDLMQRPRMR